MGISLHRDPYSTEGNLCLGEGGSYTGDFERSDEGWLLSWGTLRYVKQGSEMGFYIHRGPTFGEHGW